MAYTETDRAAEGAIVTVLAQRRAEQGERPFDQGQLALWSEVGLDCNPFPPEMSDARAQWQRGWTAAAMQAVRGCRQVNPEEAYARALDDGLCEVVDVLDRVMRQNPKGLGHLLFQQLRTAHKTACWIRARLQEATEARRMRDTQGHVTDDIPDT